MKEHQQEFENALKSMGWEVINENGVVMALVSRNEYNDSRTMISIRKAAVQAGYNESYGMRMIKEDKSANE